MLGTVQFGQPYGVANRTGQPDQGLVSAIIAAALDGGVNCLDTAAAYGTSEEVVGRALRKLGVSQRMVVVTKIRPLQPAEYDDPGLAAQAIESCVAASRQRLGVECLPLVLFHREQDARHISVLHQLRNRGWLRYVGVSCGNTPGFLNDFAARDALGAVQIPANLLDHRHQASGACETAAAAGIAVFIRSVYLQGLLVMPEQEIPPALRQVIGVRRVLQNIAGQAGMSLKELALRFMFDQAGVTSVVVGVETEAQVRDNLAICARGPIPADVRQAVLEASTDVDELLITPAMWPAAATVAPSADPESDEKPEQAAQ